MNTVSKRTFNLVLAGVMIAMGTALGFVKPFELPYGGAITLCSMLPVMFFSYRCGLKWGLSAGLVFSVLQLLFGLDALKGISAMMVVGSNFPGLYPGIYRIGLGRDVPGQDQERRGGLYPGQLCLHDAALLLLVPQRLGAVGFLQ